MRSYAMEAYELIYTEPAGEMAVEALRFKGVKGMRVKTIKSGEQVEAMCFSIVNDMEAVKRAKAAKKQSTQAQARFNEKCSYLNMERLSNANFGVGDYLGTFTYAPGKQPKSDEEAQRNMRNFIGRLKYEWDKHKEYGPMKYIYCTERTEGKGGVKYHHHMILSGNGMTRDQVEAKWPYGIANTKRYQWQENGFSGWAHYMVQKKADRQRPQEKATRRRWAASTNLVKPTITRADRKITRKQAMRIATAAETEAAAIFEKAYPNCVLLSCEVRWSQYAPGPYIYARLRKKEEHEKRKPTRAAGRR